jgi:signal transduction histidine kinase/DNA-binding response OmpR family regulator
MKNRAGYYFWIISLTVVLMLLILAAQVYTIRNINGLKTGNREAAVTFTINNRLQEIVNTATVLEARIIKDNSEKINMSAVTDSLAAMGYNASVLEKLNVDTATKINFIKLNAFIARQVSISFKILEAKESGNKALKKVYTDSLVLLKLNDSIYQTAINIEKGLEANLKNTFSRNTEASQKLSTLNKTFALIAIAAILILGTIIINRHLRQVSLIAALKKANDEVKKSAMIKEQFLANMSHEIRTPLNAIKGFSRLMQQTSLNEEQQKFSDIIENSSNNLLHLVNDILDIAKIEAGEMIVEVKEFDVKKMLQTLEFMFMNTAKEKQLDFTCKIDADVPQNLYGDPEKLYQILINLINNAFKFTDKGFIHVHVSKLIRAEKEITLQFSVEDSGIGIPLKKQELIFERFHQVSNPVENVQKGTGLGLAIVKDLAGILGGSVAVASQEGQGSVFTVILPLANVADKKPVGYNGGNVSVPVTLSGASVLVAEDNNVNQLLITRLLKQFNIEPVICENGMEVLELIKKQEFDLLLLDIQMPLLDGYKTCVAIRETGNSIPVVAMTAYVMDAEKEKCTAAGMNDYLAKPIDEFELQHILKKYLAKFIRYQEMDIGLSRNSFLLQLAGGDEQMADMILNQVKREIPVEIDRLKNVLKEKNISALPAICHNLISSISPLGNNSLTMLKITALQKMISEKESESAILKETEELVDELKNNYKNLSALKE